jgi:phospholipid transport system substrate-binding protein
MRGRLRGWMIALLSLVWLSCLGPAIAGEPTDFIKHTADSILQIFEAPLLQGPEKREDRLARLHDIANTAFDWEEMAQRALATHWRERTPQERQEFVELLRDTVQGTYLKRLEEAAPQQLKKTQEILYVGEQVDGPRAVVRTNVVTPRRLEVSIAYHLRQSQGQWRIYDVVVEGVSLLNNYRAQLHRIITASSYQALVQQMKARRGPLSQPSGTPR